MSFTPQDLLTVERHIAEGERHVVSQEAIVTKLESEGADTTLAKELLAEFNSTLQAHRNDRDLIAKLLEEPS